MKTLASLILIVLAAGCASNKKQDGVPAEAYDITQKDFERPKPYRFVPSQDYFSKVPGGKDNQALRFESSYRIDASDIDDEDVVSKLARSCQQGKFQDALDFSRKNYDRYREHPAFWNQVGVCYLLQKDTKKALLYFNKSLDFKRDYAPTYNNLGVMYWQMNEPEKALVAFKRAVEYGPFSNTPKFNLGFLYLEYQLSEKAEPLFQSLYKFGPKDKDVLVGLMTSYLFNNKYPQAEKICKIDDDLWERADFGINCAKVYYFQKNLVMAKKVLKEVDQKKMGPWQSYYAKTNNLIGGDK